jgi:hypothetical protein
MSKPLANLLAFPLIVLTIQPTHAVDPQTLAVQVCNLSRADDKLLSQAEAVAGRVFSDAGIETAWLTTDKPEPARLTVQINPGRSHRSDRRDAFGIALTDTDPSRSFLADVFLGNIEELATTRTDEAFLLGYVMAHEVGHLLGLGHAPQTVMADGWNARDIPRMQAGRVRFSLIEAERMRAAVLVRQRTP